MKKLWTALGLLFGLVNLSYGEDSLVQVSSYKLSGMTDYLTEKDVSKITEILENKTGTVTKNTLEESRKSIQEYFDTTYGIKYKVALSNGEQNIVYYEIISVISKITYDKGKSGFDKVVVNSLAVGNTQESLDKRDLQMIEDNPMRNLLLKYSLDSEGYMSAILQENSGEELHHKFFIDNYGKDNKETRQIRYGYQYINSNLMDKDDVFAFNIVNTEADSFYLGGIYHNPLEEVHGELDISVSYGEVEKSLYNFFLQEGTYFEGDVRYSYNLPIFMDNFQVRNKAYVGAKYITSRSKMSFKSDKKVFSNELEQYFIPYIGYYHNTRTLDKYFDLNLKIEGNTKGIEQHLDDDYLKGTAETNFLWQFADNKKYYLQLRGIWKNNELNKDFDENLINPYTIRASRRADNNLILLESFTIKNELEFGKKNTVYIYNDYGIGKALVENEMKKEREKKTQEIDTFGIGFRIRKYDNFRLDMNVGYDVLNTAVEKNEDKFVYGIKFELKF